MTRNTDRILVTHAGSLPRPEDVIELVWAKMDGQEVDEAELERRVESGVAEIVKKQRDAGVDIVSDGELGKPGFSTYVEERFTGFEGRSEFQADDVAPFPNLAMRLFNTPAMAHVVFSNCVGPVAAKDPNAEHVDVDRLKNALDGLRLPRARSSARSAPARSRSTTPTSTTARTRTYLGALAEELSHEYKAITDAGFNLQIDSPDLAMAAHCRSVGSERPVDWETHLPLAIEALNAALDGIPPEQVRLHVCWGNYAGPHHKDVPLAEIIGEVLKANVGTIYAGGRQPPSRARVARVRGGRAARRQIGHPRRDRRQVKLHRASPGRRGPAHAAGEDRRP